MKMTKTRVLIVDDEPGILKYVSACLHREGHEVITASNGQEGLIKAEEANPTLIILDIMMPVLDGFETCRRLREWSQAPIIMLSARGDETDKVKCLDMGADDYITKPFNSEELMARVRAVLRRTDIKAASPIRPAMVSGALKVSFAERQVVLAGKEIELTRTEYNLLQEMILSAGKVLTYTYLLNKVWGAEYRSEKEYLHVFAGKLRNKLETDPANPIYIETIAGVGYKFNILPEE